MILIRLLLMAFNAAIITFLIYRMIRITKEPVDSWMKAVVIIGGIILLLAPVGIFLRFFAATPQYFIIYPAAIFLFLYLTRQIKGF